MAKFIKGLSSMFGGGQREQRVAQIQNQTQSQEQQRIAQERQVQQLQQEQQEGEIEAARARRVPRGRRLLLAATGEDGVQQATIG
jgi:hypothetical protein